MLALAMKSNGFCDEGMTALRPNSDVRPLPNDAYKRTVSFPPVISIADVRIWVESGHQSDADRRQIVS